MTQEQMMQSIYEGMQETRQSITELKEDMGGLKTEFADMKSEFADMKSEFADMKEDMTGLKTEFADMKEEFSDMKVQMKNIQLTLENEIRHNIMIIAEGHLDLSRKLDEAMRVNQEKEMLLVRVGTLETDVRNIKTRIGIA